MGTLRLLADDDLIPQPLLNRLFVTDFEGTPCPCQATFVSEAADDPLREIQISVEENHSFYLQVPVRTKSGAETMISTATLRPRERPYILALELLRGGIHRLTNQNFEWERGGFALLEAAGERISELMKRFSSVATIPHDRERCNSESKAILHDAIELVSQFSDGITDELTSMNSNAGIPTLLGGNWRDQSLSDIDIELFKSAFDTAVVDLAWPTSELSPGGFDWTRAKEQVEICQTHGLRMISGPLLDFAPSNIPAWMEFEPSDPGQLTVRAEEFAAKAVEALAGSVHLWNVTSTMNQRQGTGLDDQARLQLTADVVQSVRQIEPKTPILVSFEQPWGEFLLGKDEQSAAISPLRFADALVRGRIGVSALGLQLDVGSWPHGIVERNGMEVLRRLDNWSRFQLPLVVFLSAASKPFADKARSCTTHLSPTQETQALTGKRMVQLLSAHPGVQGVIWNEWMDRKDSRFPTSGIVDADGKPKLLIEVLRKMQSAQTAE